MLNKEEKLNIIKEIISKNPQKNYGRKHLQQSKIIKTTARYVNKVQVDYTINKYKTINDLSFLFNKQYCSIYEQIFQLTSQLIKYQYVRNIEHRFYYDLQNIDFINRKYNINKQQIQKLFVSCYVFCYKNMEKNND